MLVHSDIVYLAHFSSRCKNCIRNINVWAGIHVPVLYMFSSASASQVCFIFRRPAAKSVHVGLPTCICLVIHESTISTMHCSGLALHWSLMSSSMESGTSRASPRLYHMAFTLCSWISRTSRFNSSSGGEGEKCSSSLVGQQSAH